MDELLRRNYVFEIRADKNDDNGTFITGRPIVFESKTNLGYFDEVIEDVRFLVNHDTNKIPLARSRNNNKNSTMQLMPDDDGMGIRVNLDVENNAEARALYSAVKRGDISGMSFMFGIDGEEWEALDSDHPTRHITSISSVVEVSAVTFPAYEATEISARDRTALDNARSVLDSARKPNEMLELFKLKNQILGGN